MNIVLIGTIEAGKTTVGGALAKLSGYKFVDTDRLVKERMECRYWSPFRYAREFWEKEAEVIDEVAKQNDIVIATSALVVSHVNAIRKLRENGVIIRLKPDLQTVINRFKKDKRPVLVPEGMSYEEGIELDYKTYIDDYNDYDYSMEVSDEETPESYADRIWEWVKNHQHELS